MHCKKVILVFGLITFVASDSKKDLYEILGVKRNVTPKAIGSAFRKLALKYHPDRNKDDPEAEKKFVEISKAYEILSDKEKRERYDRFGDTGEGQDGFGQQAHSFNFDDFFGAFESNHNFHGRGGHFKPHFGFDNFFEEDFEEEGEEEEADMIFNFGDVFEDFFEAPHSKYGRQANQDTQSFFSSSSHHNSGGRKCHTVTQKIGNMITTHTECS